MTTVAHRRQRTPRVVTASLLRGWIARTIVAGLLLSVLTVVAPATSSAATVDEVLEEQLFRQLNDERAARGLAPFASHNGLDAASRTWSDRMASESSLYHSSDGRAEIIARGWWTGQITDAWMRSDGHRNLVVDPNLGWAGVGVTCGPNGQVWATVQFLRIDTSLGTLGSSAAQPRVTDDAVGSDCGEQSSIDQIRRLYVAYFRRESDGAGLAYWASELTNGASLGQVSHAFASSPEFRQRYGTLNDREFVRLVYVNVLGREPDEKGYRYWTSELRQGMSRGSLMLGFSESGEFKAATGIG